jgi:hypothetical protein
VIPGKGVLVWANGKRYEGYWENGVPQGKGINVYFWEWEWEWEWESSWAARAE